MNVKIEKRVVDKLIRNKLTLSLAESCTGGLIASKLTSIPGASAVFIGGIVTYTNEYKEKVLGVKKTTLEEFTAVSSNVAKEMAMGLRDIIKTDLVGSITGLAGPDGGTDEIPVGRVYICLGNNSSYYVKELNLEGNRDGIREEAANILLAEIENIIDLMEGKND